MNPEIRFNPPPKVEQSKDEPKISGNRLLWFKIWSKKILKLLVIIFIFGLVISLGFFGKSKMGSIFEKKDAYTAVFLLNGQVYFGKLVKNTDDEIVLNNVYYLQVGAADGLGANNTLNQTRFNLIKLGNELHGPTDELFINKAQITFYEYLRSDSKVVESIKNYTK